MTWRPLTLLSLSTLVLGPAAAAEAQDVRTPIEEAELLSDFMQGSLTQAPPSSGRKSGRGGSLSEEGRTVIAYQRPAVVRDGPWSSCPEGTQPFWKLSQDTVTGELQFIEEVCFGAGERPDAGGPEAERIWDATPLPDIAVTLSPHHDGATGMDTWLWYEGPGVVDLTVTLGGFALDVSARPVAFCWVMDDARGELPPGDHADAFCSTQGQPGTYLADTSGSESQPAATHLYEVKGDYRVTLEALWQGSYTFAGTTYPLGEVVRRGSRDYRVIEIRSVPAD